MKQASKDFLALREKYNSPSASGYTPVDDDVFYGSSSSASSHQHVDTNINNNKQQHMNPMEIDEHGLEQKPGIFLTYEDALRHIFSLRYRALAKYQSLNYLPLGPKYEHHDQVLFSYFVFSRLPKPHRLQ